MSIYNMYASARHTCYIHTLKLRGDITRSPKKGYQWPHKKDLYVFLKKELVCRHIKI